MYKKESFCEWVVGWPGQAVQCALLTIRTGQIHNCLAQAKSDQLQFVSTNIRVILKVLTYCEWVVRWPGQVVLCALLTTCHLYQILTGAIDTGSLCHTNLKFTLLQTST